MSDSSKVPTSKVAAAGYAVLPAVGFAQFIQWLLLQFGVVMGDTVMLGIAAFIPVVVGYLVEEKRGDKDQGGRHAAE